MNDPSKQLDPESGAASQTSRSASDADRWDRRFRIEGDPLDALRAVVAGFSEKIS